MDNLVSYSIQEGERYVFSQFGKELSHIVRNKKLLIPIIAVLLVPLMYSGMFLWAFWNPYDKLNDLPVAVVNLDEGATVDGKSLNVGKDLVDNLKKDDNFKWKFVSNEKAMKGLKKQDYYMAVRIPKDFSKNAATVTEKNPKHLTMEYIPNEGFNFISSQIGNSATEKIKEEVAQNITRNYVETIYDNIGELTDGIAQASDGSSKLDNGVGDAKGGSQKLANGLKVLASKSIELKEGVSKLNDGSQKEKDGLVAYTNGVGQLSNGINQLHSGVGPLSKGIGDLNAGASKLNTGMSSLSSGLDQLYSANGQLLDGSKQVLGGLNSLNGNLPQLKAGTQQLADGANTLSTNLTEWQKKANEAKAGADQVAAGLTELEKAVAPLLSSLPKEQQAAYKAKLDALVSGSEQVATGVGGLSSAAGQLSQGGKQVASGATTLNEKSNELSAGVGKLVAGQTQVTNGLNQFGEKLGEANNGGKQIASGAQALANGTNKLYESSPTLISGINQLNDGANKLNSNSPKLVDGMSQIAGGIGQVNSNTPALENGVNQLADGSNQLNNGLGKLKDGSNELATKLGDAKNQTKDADANNKQLDMYSNPVKLKKESVNKVPNYGTGFTPYFLSMALYLGGLLLSNVYPFRDPLSRPKNAFSWFASKAGILIGVGIIQAVLASVLLLFALDLEVQSLPYYFLISFVSVLAFMALVQFLATVFGDAGKLLAVIVLVLQLTTSAGTYPLETLPTFLQHFYGKLPMTYTIQAFKAVISSGDYSYMWQNVYVLLGFFIFFSLLTLGYFTIIFKKQYGSGMDQKNPSSVEA
jgi:putative membrane protein